MFEYVAANEEESGIFRGIRDKYSTALATNEDSYNLIGQYFRFNETKETKWDRYPARRVFFKIDFWSLYFSSYIYSRSSVFRLRRTRDF